MFGTGKDAASTTRNFAVKSRVTGPVKMVKKDKHQSSVHSSHSAARRKRVCSVLWTELPKYWKNATIKAFSSSHHLSEELEQQQALPPTPLEPISYKSKGGMVNVVTCNSARATSLSKRDHPVLNWTPASWSYHDRHAKTTALYLIEFSRERVHFHNATAADIYVSN